MFEVLIKALRKSFSWDSHLREIFTCHTCGSGSFVEGKCLYCATRESYEKEEKR